MHFDNAAYLFSSVGSASVADIENIEKFLEERDQDFFSNIEVESLIGASGSFETFYELLEGSFFEANGQAQKVNTEHFFKMLDQIIASTQAERDANPHIIAIRKRMAPLAAIKTRWVLQKTQAKQIFISPNSLKEGVLFG